MMRVQGKTVQGTAREWAERWHAARSQRLFTSPELQDWLEDQPETARVRSRRRLRSMAATIIATGRRAELFEATGGRSADWRRPPLWKRRC